jgi:Xaa-Pro aminopeptidase
MTLAPNELIADRRARVGSALEPAGVDSLVVVHLPNIYYLTGFTGTAAILVIRAAGADFITDGRYTTSAGEIIERAGGDLRLVRVEYSYEETLADLLKHTGARRIGIEAGYMTVSRYEWLRSQLGDAAALVPLEGIIEQARIVKDAHEVAAVRRGARLLETGAAAQLPRVRAGVTERELAAELDSAIKRAGFSKPAFETIVASGPNSALPHARPTDRTLERGDLVVLDFGGVYDGYCVDLTRCVSLGPPSAEYMRLYEGVAAAHAAAIAAVQPGVLGSTIDAAAREELTRRGLGAAFSHGTGHGLGVEIHEEPRISRRRPDGAADPRDRPVAAGMIFTIEPGAYVPGVGGVRLEDDVLVTADGCEILTNVPRELIIG